MNKKEISATYKIIKEHHDKYLKVKGVELPNLKKGDKFIKDALVLVYLAKNYPNTNIVTKSDLTQFIRRYYKDTTDVQQARHLAAQKGWYILSGTRKDNNSLNLKSGEYKLVSLTECYPDFTKERREYKEDEDFFESLKRQYGYCCATCGSEEGKPHKHWKNTKTVLQKGHMNPLKPLEEGNIIPQCEKCNRADRNYWIYDKKGRVIAIANEKVIDKCSTELQRRIYERLKLIFEK